jgi:hypothetical protein
MVEKRGDLIRRMLLLLLCPQKQSWTLENAGFLFIQAPNVTTVSEDG